MKKENYSLKHTIFSVKALLTFFQTTAFAGDPPGIPNGWSDGYVYANGIRIHYYQAVPAPEKPSFSSTP